MKISKAKFRTPVELPRRGTVSESSAFSEVQDDCVCESDSYGNLTFTGPRGTVLVPGTNVAYIVPFPTELVKKTTSKK